MRDRRHPTLAARFRAARENYLLANQLGVTPARAAEIAKELEVRSRWEAADRRLAARAAAKSRPIPTIVVPAERPRRWWED